MKTNFSVQNTLTPTEAYNKLKEGHFRFLNNIRQHRDPYDDIDKTKSGQSPFTAIVACMDSRVSTEMVFDLGIGDMFSLRIAGNIVTTGILGSLEYATEVVGSSLIVVMGHSSCGAIKGACDNVELGNLSSLLAHIRPAVELERSVTTNRTSSNPEFVEAVSHINVRVSVQEIIQHSPVISALVRQGKVGIMPAMYDVATGKVRFLEEYAIMPDSTPESVAAA